MKDKTESCRLAACSVLVNLLSFPQVPFFSSSFLPPLPLISPKNKTHTHHQAPPAKEMNLRQQIDQHTSSSFCREIQTVLYEILQSSSNFFSLSSPFLPLPLLFLPSPFQPSLSFNFTNFFFFTEGRIQLKEKAAVVTAKLFAKNIQNIRPSSPLLDKFVIFLFFYLSILSLSLFLSLSFSLQ